MKSLTIKLWAIFCVTVFAILVAQYFGVFSLIWATDITKLSFVMITLLLIIMLYLVVEVWRGKIPDLKPFWYLSENFLNMGLIATVIGMIYVFTSANIGALDMSNPEMVKIVMLSMAVGVGTKLWATLIGLVCAGILKPYLVLIEKFQDEESLKRLQESQEEFEKTWGINLKE